MTNDNELKKANELFPDTQHRRDPKTGHLQEKRNGQWRNCVLGTIIPKGK